MSTNIGRRLAVAGLITLLCGAWADASLARGKRPETIPELNTSRLIVKYPGSGETSEPAPIQQGQLKALAAELGVSVRFLRRMAQGADVFEFSSPVVPARMRQLAARLIEADPNIEFAEPDMPMMPLALPNDPLAAQQWNFFEPLGGIRLDTAWGRSVGAGVVVAVIDTGALPHVDLVDNLLPGRDFISGTPISRDGDGRDGDATDTGDWYHRGQCVNDLNNRGDSTWHGTHVAGTVAALSGNGTGVAGIAPGAKVLPLRAMGRCGGYTSDIADAIVWASGGSVPGSPANPTPAQVINLSLGWSGACSQAYRRAIDTARGRGSVVVVAAGNASRPAAEYTPANCPGVIAVGASDRAGNRAYYSNHGAALTLLAPGGDMRSSLSDGVLSTMNAGTKRPGADIYQHYQGTSMAAPHVAGVAALMLSVNPSLTPSEVSRLLKATARPAGSGCSKGCGAGLLDAAAAVEAAQAAR